MQTLIANPECTPSQLANAIQDRLIFLSSLSSAISPADSILSVEQTREMLSLIHADLETVYALFEAYAETAANQ